MKKAIITNILGVLFFCLLCTLAGCSKDDASEGASRKSEVLVTVNLSEASWGIEQSAGQAKASAGEISIPMQEGVLIATLEPNTPAQTRSTEINYGVGYRLVAYKENDVSATGYVNHADFVKGGVAPTFWLQTDRTYTLVCYSYNSAEAMPEFNKSISAIEVSPEKDFLYGKKNVAITAENRSIAMEMQHLFSQVTVIADASADNYIISACSGTFMPNYNATLSLIDGSLTKGSSVSKAINWNSFGSVTATSMPAQVYTNGETVTLALDSITIGETTVKNKSFTFVGKAMITGNGYVLRFKLKKEILPIVLNNLTWAPGNLIASSNGDGTFTYSFVSSQEYYSGIWNGGDYFCWNTLDPSSLFSSNATDDYKLATDPCQQVAPAGTWRMPTKDEFATLINSGSVWTTRNGIEGRYFGTTTAPAQGSEDDYLFLPAAGIRYYETTEMQYLGTASVYWSATALDTTMYACLLQGSVPEMVYHARSFAFSVRCVK